jgi:hypothetical protein
MIDKINLKAVAVQAMDSIKALISEETATEAKPY